MKNNSPAAQAPLTSSVELHSVRAGVDAGEGAATVVTTTAHTLQPTNKTKRSSTLGPIILLLLGLSVLLYPVLASQFNNYNQQVVVDEYRKLLSEASQEDLNQSLANAQMYNQLLSATPALEPWPARVANDNPAYQDYLSQLSLFPMMGVIEIPSIEVNLPIYHGTTDETLDKGIGHLFGTDLPVGGTGTHAVLTGHTGLPYATMFDRLVDVEKGDEFSIYVAGEHLLYRVRDIQVVKPDEVDSLYPVEGEDLLTLVTCTPYGVNSHRLLVTGERIDLPEENVHSAPDNNHLVWQPWMIAVLAVVALVVLYAGRKVFRKNRKQKETQNAHT